MVGGNGNGDSRPGATGRFPEGKLNLGDEGELRVIIGEKDDTVIVDFGTPVVWIGVTAPQAVEMAERLIAKARVVAKRQGITLTVNLS